MERLGVIKDQNVLLSGIDKELSSTILECTGNQKETDMNNNYFNVNKDLLVLPTNFKVSSLDNDAAKIVRELLMADRVIKLDYIKTPAVVSSR